MKFLKLAAIVVLLFAVAGCGTAAQRSDWHQHDTMYRNWDHLKFSWSGWQKPDLQDVENSDGQKWWGEEVKADNVK